MSYPESVLVPSILKFLQAAVNPFNGEIGPLRLVLRQENGEES